MGGNPHQDGAGEGEGLGDFEDLPEVLEKKPTGSCGENQIHRTKGCHVLGEGREEGPDQRQEQRKERREFGRQRGPWEIPDVAEPLPFRDGSTQEDINTVVMPDPWRKGFPNRQARRQECDDQPQRGPAPRYKDGPFSLSNPVGSY